jgi:predicted acylesterase/phospholipase RssA
MQYLIDFLIGWNLPGTFARLAVHLGMILAWLNAGLPLPSLIVATSAGAIMSACCVSFDRAVVRRVVHLIRYLHRGQIFTLSRGMYKTGFYMLVGGATLVLAAASAGSLNLWAPLLLALAVVCGMARFGMSRFRISRLPVIVLPPFRFALVVLIVVATLAAWKTNAWIPVILFATGLAAADLSVHRALHVFFRECDSLFDNTPLRNLLLGENVAQNAFRAETELLVLAADVATPECVVYSNHEARLCDPTNQEHCQQFIDGVLNSAALPARFQARTVRGRKALDGEIWTDAGYHKFLDKDKKPRVKIVFRFDYWEPLGPGPVPETIIENMLVPFDRMRDRCTIKKMEEYRYERQHDPDLPRIVNIRASSQLLAKIPNVAVHNFNPGDLWRAIKFGRAILRENLPMIRRELGLDEEVA